MNNVVLMGNLTRDPEVRETKDKMVIATYTIAVRRNSDESDFIRCVAFDKAGEFAERYFKKGMKVCISGRIQTGSYQDKDKVTHYTTDVIINTQEFAQSKAENENNKPEENDNRRSRR